MEKTTTENKIRIPQAFNNCVYALEQAQSKGAFTLAESSTILDSILSQNWLALKGSLTHLALPAITLGILLSGIFSRALRLNLSRTLESDYIEAARSRGIKESQIVMRHALPNALLPVLTIAGITIACD